MYTFKFNDFNINKNFGQSSHQLTGTRVKELTKFVTFDSESTTKYYHEKKEITSNQYDKLTSDKKYKVFTLKVITACFVINQKITNIIYISGKSEYTKKTLNMIIPKENFSNQTIEQIEILSKVKYYKNETEMCYSFFSDIEKFHSKQNTALKVFCHNGKHDWIQCKIFLLHKLKQWQLKNFRFSIPRFVTFDLPKKKKLIFLDTVNYFKQKLETIGEDVGISKLTDNVDFKKEIIVDELFLRYALIDAVILAYKLIQFNNQTKNLGTIGFGIASTAYNIWRTSYLNEKIWLHKNKCLMKIERMSYFGGRTEAFRLGFFKNVNGIDINSQYPYQMTKGLPVRYIKTIRATTKEEINILHRKYLELSKKYCLICEVLVSSTLKIPIVPLKHKSKLMFVNGLIPCVLCQPEIDLLIKSGEKILIQGIHIYKKGYPFKKFALDFYNNKQEMKKLGNEAMEKFYKLILNSSYGKTGEREISEINRSCDKNFIGKIIEIIGGKEYHFNCLGGLMKASKFLDSDSKNAFTPIAAFITSYARSYLHESMQKLGYENILYCDTDSIFTTLSQKEIDKKLKIDKLKLGYWSYDYKNVDMVIYGVKDYIILKNGQTVKQKLKGINLKNSSEIDVDEWLCERWTTINHAIKIEDLEHQQIINQKKVLTRDYTKSQVINSQIKEIKIDGKIKKYVKADLKHFDIDDLN